MPLPTHENATSYKWQSLTNNPKQTSKIKSFSRLFEPLTKHELIKVYAAFGIATFLCIKVSAQQNSFTIDHRNNPLKNFSVATNKESHPFFADIDGDGDVDCFSGEYANNHLSKIYFYRNDGTNKSPLFKQVTGAGNPLDKVATNTLTIPYLVDIDKDGDYDCFIGEGSTGAVLYYKNTGTSTNPVFQKQSAAHNPLSMVKFSASGVANPAFADVDGDGDYDCLVVDEDGNENYFKNTGTAKSPVFVHAKNSDDPFSSLTLHADAFNNPSFFDWDHDGMTDLFINTTYFKNVGTVNKPEFVASSENKPLFQNKSGSAFTYVPLRWVDINNDGHVEVFQGNSDGSFVYETLSSGSNSAAVAIPIAKARVLPNPTKQEFVVNLLTKTNAGTAVRVTDAQGKIITTQFVTGSTLKFGKEFKPGTYFMQVMQNNKVIYTQKLIKE
ncbi:MAG TPA: T9SS type A sorting domain-containing protein [Chitinophagaceae bacterium]